MDGLSSELDKPAPEKRALDIKIEFELDLYMTLIAITILIIDRIDCFFVKDFFSKYDLDF